MILFAYVKLTNADVSVLLKINPLVLLASSFFVIISDIVRAYRLKVLSNYVKSGLSFKESVIIWEASRLFALLTPGFYGGEVLRIGYIAKKYDLAKGIVVNVLEVTSESAAISVNAILSFILLSSFFDSTVNVASLTFSLLISAFLLAVSVLVQLTKRCPGKPEKLKKYCLPLLEAFEVAGLEAFGAAFAISLVGVVIYVFSIATIAQALNVNAFVAALVFACSLPATAIPITPGGIGLPEAIATLALPNASSVLIAWRLLNILTVLASSLFVLSIYGREIVSYLRNEDFKGSSGKELRCEI
ncbi:hypothetical protein EYM_06925 [Ignicoccus islandicus DSM 13165]|uniref:Lysylphosphatidylglycerol synthetase n=1 Tax=Ignicoccus islandicus DSM 13165 TaxID=940295 RepID=A0A0U3EE64_9CREN|nr:hypothetical protein EYM_06925 [Ignicoccus islandicus DSM 13165]